MRIGITGHMDRQARLMGEMMERAGVNPATATRRPQAFAAAVRRCLWCASAETCERWQSQVGFAKDIPAFCPNREFFTDIRAASQAQDGGNQ